MESNQATDGLKELVLRVIVEVIGDKISQGGVHGEKETRGRWNLKCGHRKAIQWYENIVAKKSHPLDRVQVVKLKIPLRESQA